MSDSEGTSSDCEIIYRCLRCPRKFLRQHEKEEHRSWHEREEEGEQSAFSSGLSDTTTTTIGKQNEDAETVMHVFDPVNLEIPFTLQEGQRGKISISVSVSFENGTSVSVATGVSTKTKTIPGKRKNNKMLNGTANKIPGASVHLREKRIIKCFGRGNIAQTLSNRGRKNALKKK